MGVGMANNLAKAGRQLVVWNRSPEKSRAFAAEHAGCSAAATPAEASLPNCSLRSVIAACDVTYLMLSDLEASNAVYNDAQGGVLSALKAGKCLVDCATLTPEHMAKLDRLVTERGGTFLEAPVSGSKGPAAQGTLIFLTGGNKALYERACPDLDLMGKKSYFFGATGKGTEMKLVVNMTMGSMMACLAEGVSLAEASGLPVPDLLEVFDLGAMANPMFKIKGPNMIKGEHAPNFPLKHAQKDMRFALGLGDKVGQPLPVAAAANEIFKRARVAHGDEDMSAIYEAVKK
ncbi:unnamed protein product [Phaeothamnion confervicola]